MEKELLLQRTTFFVSVLLLGAGFTLLLYLLDTSNFLLLKTFLTYIVSAVIISIISILILITRK